MQKGFILACTVCCLLLFQSLWAAESVADANKAKRQRERVIQLITALTDSRQRVNEQAITALAQVGAPALADLSVLARDEQPTLRLRVTLVVTQIDAPEATALLLSLSQDSVAAVREVAALGLGRKKGDDVLRRLAVLIEDEEAGVRESAALAMGFVDDGRAIRLLANSLVAEHVPETAMPDQEREIARAKSAKYESLKSLVLRPQQLPWVARYINQLHGPALQYILELTWELGDPRLCEPLLTVFDRDVSLKAHNAAAKSLQANGDSRCLGVLCRIAGSKDGPRQEAARTLSLLTGHEAKAGKAWTLWWRDHREAVQKLHARDAFLAKLHDVSYVPTRAELSAFPVKNLSSLLEGVLGEGAKHWPAQALAAIRIDDPSRWTQFLLDQYGQEGDEVRRVGILLLLYELGDPKAVPLLSDRYALMNKSMKQAEKLGDLRKSWNSERLVLKLFTEQ